MDLFSFQDEGEEGDEEDDAEDADYEPGQVRTGLLLTLIIARERAQLLTSTFCYCYIRAPSLSGNIILLFSCRGKSQLVQHACPQKQVIRVFLFHGLVC